MRFRTIALAAAAGAAVAYLFDPISGGARRRRLLEQLPSLPMPRRARDRGPLPENLVPTSTPDRPAAVAPRTYEPPRVTVPEMPATAAATAAATVPAADESGPDDATIAREVRMRLESRPDLETGELVIDVVRGVAYLRGDLKDQETFDEIVDLTSAVPGVRRVQSLLHVPNGDAATWRDRGAPGAIAEG